MTVPDTKFFNYDFAKSASPYENYVQFSLLNKNMYKNFLKMHGTPARVLCIKREVFPAEPQGKSWSFVDKYIQAYGRAPFAADMNLPKAYKAFDTFIGLQKESFTKKNEKWTENLLVTVAWEPDFKYGQSDRIIFKFNNYIFMFEIADIPRSYNDILWEITLKYCKKNSIVDEMQIPQDVPPTTEQENELW